MKLRWEILVLGLTACLGVSPETILAADATETRFGFYTDRATVSVLTVVISETLDRRVSEIGQRVAKTLDRPDMTWTFRVINDPAINAYSAAAGFVYVNTGLLDVLEAEDELAAVMAHEIVHTGNGHQIKFLRSANQKKAAGQAVGILLGAALAVGTGMAVQSAYSPSASPALVNQSVSETMNLSMQVGQATGGAIAVSMIKGYGKKQELEADSQAIRCLEKAGYDPNALIRVLKKLMAIRDRLNITEKNYVSSLINAEPGLEQRVATAETTIAKGEPDPNTGRK
jgi:predicted Zn-dependent protease